MYPFAARPGGGQLTISPAGLLSGLTAQAPVRVYDHSKWPRSRAMIIKAIDDPIYDSAQYIIRHMLLNVVFSCMLDDMAISMIVTQYWYVMFSRRRL